MDMTLHWLAERQGGAFTRRQALEAGYSVDGVNHLLGTREWLRLRKGVYTVAKIYLALDEAARYVARTHAAALSLRRCAVVSHTSAIALHGLPLWGSDLSVVHFSRTRRGGSRLEAGIDHHRTHLPPDHVEQRDRLLVTVPARSVVDAAGLGSFESAVVIADAALHAGLTSPAGLEAALDAARGAPGSHQVVSALAFADARAESPGESRCRVLFKAQGLPAPEPQVRIVDDYGVLVGRVDFLFREERTIVEFDGLMKYGLGPNAPIDDLVAEKQREDWLRELGYEIVRLTWADLADPVRTAARIRAAFTRARRRRALR